MANPPNIPGGYVILGRCIFDGSYAGRPPWEFKLWVWMLAQANHKPKRNGQKLDRGQLLTTLAQMQDAVAYWVGGRRVVPGKSSISRFLKRLASEIPKATRRQREGNAVATAKTTRGLIITICNYNHYQTAVNYESNGEIPPKATRRQREGTHDRQEGKNEEGKKKKTALTAAPPVIKGFDIFWDAYPKKKGKADARKAWDEVSEGVPPLNQIIAAIITQAKSPDWMKQQGQYIPYPATWLRGERWADEVGPVNEEPDNEANPRCRRPDEDCLPMSAEKYAEIMGTPQ